MKTAELFNKYFTMLSDQPVVTKDAFEKAIIEHDNDIELLVESLLKQQREICAKIYWVNTNDMPSRSDLLEPMILNAPPPTGDKK